MQIAYVDLGSLTFQPKCPHCGRPAETRRAIAAQRNLDALLGEYGLVTLIDVPVCRDDVRRRRVAGALSVVLWVALLGGGGFAALTLALNDARVLAGLLTATLVVVTTSQRAGWTDAWLDRSFLGVSARRAKGANRVQLTFVRDEYFSEWAAMNPSASSSAGAMGWQPARPKADAPAPVAFSTSRTIPAIVLAVTSATIALHHWYAKGGGHVFLSALVLLTAFAFLAAAGLVYPPVLWSVGIHGKHLPMPVRIAGAAIGIAGAAAGFILGLSYGHR